MNVLIDGKLARARRLELRELAGLPLAVRVRNGVLRLSTPYL